MANSALTEENLEGVNPFGSSPHVLDGGESFADLHCAGEARSMPMKTIFSPTWDLVSLSLTPRFWQKTSGNLEIFLANLTLR